MLYKIFILLILSVIKTTSAQLRCYACSFSSVDSDQSCLTITNSTTTVDCPVTYCTIMRQEFIDPAGVVASFTRGCEQSPDFLNHEITDSTFRTYYRACTNDLCNIGSGYASTKGFTKIFPKSGDRKYSCIFVGPGTLSERGNGIQSVVGGSLSPTPEYDGKNLLVPGTGNGINLQNNFVLLIVTLALFFLNI